MHDEDKRTQPIAGCYERPKAKGGVSPLGDCPFGHTNGNVASWF
jgi:hypothetical protein